MKVERQYLTQKCETSPGAVTKARWAELRARAQREGKKKRKMKREQRTRDYSIKIS